MDHPASCGGGGPCGPGGYASVGCSKRACALAARDPGNAWQPAGLFPQSCCGSLRCEATAMLLPVRQPDEWCRCALRSRDLRLFKCQMYILGAAAGTSLWQMPGSVTGECDACKPPKSSRLQACIELPSSALVCESCSGFMQQAAFPVCGLAVSLFVSSCERHVESVCSCVVPIKCSTHRCTFPCPGANAVWASVLAGLHQVTLSKAGTLHDQKPCAIGTVLTSEMRGTPDRSGDIPPCKMQHLYAIIP
jgi:hypothetical protein